MSNKNLLFEFIAVANTCIGNTQYLDHYDMISYRMFQVRTWFVGHQQPWVETTCSDLVDRQLSSRRVKMKEDQQRILLAGAQGTRQERPLPLPSSMWASHPHHHPYPLTRSISRSSNRSLVPPRTTAGVPDRPEEERRPRGSSRCDDIKVPLTNLASVIPDNVADAAGQTTRCDFCTMTATSSVVGSPAGGSSSISCSANRLCCSQLSPTSHLNDEDKEGGSDYKRYNHSHKKHTFFFNLTIVRSNSTRALRSDDRLESVATGYRISVKKLST